VDDLKSIIEYHEQVLRSLESQISQLFEGEQETKQQMKKNREQADLSMKQFNQRMDRLEAFMARAFRLGVTAARRERVRRQQEERRRHEEDQWLGEQDRRLEKQIAVSRAEWEKKMTDADRQRAQDGAEWEKRASQIDQQHARDHAAWEKRMIAFQKQHAAERAEYAAERTKYAAERAEAEKRSDVRMTRVEANLDRFLKGLQGSNGKAGPALSEA